MDDVIARRRLAPDALKDQAIQTPVAYLTRWRMCLATKLLTETELSLEEVAARVRSLGELARWKVRPACAYAAGWAERHPEYGALLI